MMRVVSGEGQWGTEEHVFNRILTHNSHAQLKLVFQQYKEVSGGRCIEEALRGELSGDLLEGLLAIGEIVVQCYSCGSIDSMSCVGSGVRAGQAAVLRAQTAPCHGGHGHR